MGSGPGLGPGSVPYGSGVSVRYGFGIESCPRQGPSTGQVWSDMGLGPSSGLGESGQGLGPIRIQDWCGFRFGSGFKSRSRSGLGFDSVWSKSDSRLGPILGLDMGQGGFG